MLSESVNRESVCMYYVGLPGLLPARKREDYLHIQGGPTRRRDRYAPPWLIRRASEGLGQQRPRLTTPSSVSRVLSARNSLRATPISPRCRQMHRMVLTRVATTAQNTLGESRNSDPTAGRPTFRRFRSRSQDWKRCRCGQGRRSEDMARRCFVNCGGAWAELMDKTKAEGRT